MSLATARAVVWPLPLTSDNTHPPLVNSYPESLKGDDTLIGRLAEAEQLVAELGPPADPAVRRAWQGYRGAVSRYELAVQHAADGALEDMRAALAQANARAAPALTAFASHRR